MFRGVNRRTKEEYKVDVGYERFLAPEVFFSPEIVSSDFTTSLPEVVDPRDIGSHLANHA